MAVFTKLNKSEIDNFLKTYDIGELDNYTEIIEGIENTNYKIICDSVPYILTIFEKRVRDEDLPFFINLKLYLSENNFKCPIPIKNKDGIIINTLKNKKAIVISFIEGKKISQPDIEECKEIGQIVGDLHNLTKNFKFKRENSLGTEEWKNIFNKCEHNAEKQFHEIIIALKNEINFLEKSLPKNLPSGIIHADLFKDNIFFKEKKIVGVIDFYFSCYHFFLYDIAIIINDWCFDENGKEFNQECLNSIIKGYNVKRNFTIEEKNTLNIVLRAATVRILITRLHDYIFHPKDAFVVKKDPFQYYNILKWHQNNNITI